MLDEHISEQKTVVMNGGKWWEKDQSVIMNVITLNLRLLMNKSLHAG